MPGYRFRRLVCAGCVITCGLFCGTGWGAYWRVVQLTNNMVDDREPRISAGHVVWTQGVGSDTEILYYDGHDVVALTDNEVEDVAPDICVADPNVTICWHAAIGPSRTTEVLYWDGTAIRPLTDNIWRDRDAVCSDGRVVWRQKTNRADWEIFDYRPRHGVRRLTDDEFEEDHLAVSGMFTAWRRIPDPTSAVEIWFHDGTQAEMVTSGTIETGMNLGLSGSHLAWTQSVDGYQQVWDYQPGGSVRCVTSDHDHKGDLVVCGPMIGWSGGLGEAAEIYLYDGAVVRRLTYNAVADGGLRMTDRWVVWTRTTPGDSRSDVVVYDLQRGGETVLASPYATNFEPQVDGEMIVWTVNDGQDYEIMLAIACEEMPGDANRDCVVDLQDLAALAADWTRCTAPAEYCP